MAFFPVVVFGRKLEEIKVTPSRTFYQVQNLGFSAENQTNMNSSTMISRNRFYLLRLPIFFSQKCIYLRDGRDGCTGRTYGTDYCYDDWNHH